MNKLFLILAGVCALEASAVLEPATLINHNMVLQRGRSVPVWGKADPGVQIKVTFGPTTVTAKADATGAWRADLPAMAACADGRTLSIASSSGETVACTNVVVGEVWLCGGQSNMTFAMWPAPRVGKHAGRERNGYYDIMLTDEPDIRGVSIPLLWSAEPKGLTRQNWFTFTRGQGGSFSGAAYHYALRLHQALKVPVGVIVSAWGGTRIEPWIPACGYEKVAGLKELATRPIRTEPTENEKALAAKNRRKPALHQQARALYNAMIHPLAPYALRGAIWYQGEANRGQWEKYYDQLLALRAGWAEKFETPEMPLFIAQITPYGYTDTDEADPGTTQIREEMARFGATEKNCGTAILSDVGELDNIHPGDKRTVGTRLAALALNRTYGRKDILCDAPKVKAVSPVKDGKVTLTFDYVKGWVMNGEQPLRFEMAGADGKYVAVKSELKDTGVVLEVPAGLVPEKVAYMRLSRWHGFLKNEAGLPLGPFRAAIPKN